MRLAFERKRWNARAEQRLVEIAIVNKKNPLPSIQGSAGSRFMELARFELATPRLPA
jgi:hypothetical protein